MVSLFKDRSPVTIIWLFLLSLVVHSHLFVGFSGVNADRNDGLLSIWLKQNVEIFTGPFAILLFHAIIIIEALRLNHLFTDHRMYSKQNYLAAMVYILLSGIFREWTAITPALLDNLLVIWFFAMTVKLYNNNNPKALLFNIGLVIGISILLYHPSALLILVAFFAVMIVRPFVITEWVVLLMGVLAPYYFLATYLYLTDRIHTFVNYVPDWGLNVPLSYVTVPLFVTIGLIVILLIIGLIYWQVENRRLLIQVRKNWVVLLVMLIVMLPVPFVNEGAGIESLFLWIVPASPFIAKGFLAPKKNTLPNLLFWSLLALAILKNWEIIK